MSAPMTPTLRRAVERLRALPPSEQERHGRRILHDLDPGDAPPPHAWLDALAEAQVEGPPDWSENINEYLTGDRPLEPPPDTSETDA